MLPFNYLVNPKEEALRSLLAERSLLVLLVLIHYCKCLLSEETMMERNDDCASSDAQSKESTYLSNNPYCNALQNTRDVECKASSFEVFCCYYT